MELGDIEKYIRTLIADELEFKNQNISPITDTKPTDNKIQLKGLIKLIKLIMISSLDFVNLFMKVRFNANSLKNKRIVYTARNFCNLVDGKLVDRVLKPLFTDDIIFINQSKEIPLDKINDQKVYNLGGLVKLLSLFFYAKNSKLMRLYRSYSAVNNAIIRNLRRQQNVYMLWFYDLNSLSLIFSKYRDNVTLVEVQHGSIVNYPPYIKPAPVKIADIFYVKNEPTIEYLKTHLCLHHPADYRLIPYPKGSRQYMPGIHILYASTVEFNGLHPVMKNFLAAIDMDDIHLIIRLHPREKEKEPVFVEQMRQYKIDYRFDKSENWLDGNSIENLIVVSPWSSSIEDSYDNGFTTIIIDPVGRERFKHLIDNQRCYYTDNILALLDQIEKNQKIYMQL